MLGLHHVTKLHPALDPHNHVLPQLHRFLNNGDGLGLHYNQLLPKGVNVADLTADKLYDVAVSIFSWDTLRNFNGHVSNWYMTHDPFNLVLGACFYLSVFCWVVGEITGNASVVDRLWTFIPLAYTIHYTFYDHLHAGTFTKTFLSYTGRNSTWQEMLMPEGTDPRMMLIVVLQVLWCARLTIHALGRGFFTSFVEEDYRWPWLRQRLSKWQFKILALTFIAFMQNILFVVMALPQYLLMTARANRHPTHAPPPLNWVDGVIAGLFLTVLVIEEIGDNQQQEYQNWKRDPKLREKTVGKSQHEQTIAAGKMNRGFRTDGLFAWSRHPNFACEQFNYWVLYLFTLRATVPKAVFTHLFSALQQIASKSIESKSIDTDSLIELAKETGPHLINYSLLSPIAVTILFYSSTLLTEYISSSKYPLYRAYQSRVDMFWPNFTVVKIVWLAVTARLSKINAQVFRGGVSTAQKKKKTK